MGKIPKAKSVYAKNIVPNNLSIKKSNVCFSFETLNKTEYFNLDGTCEKWSSDLIDTLNTVSKIPADDIYCGKYSGKNSPLRIHQHKNAKAPSKLPDNINLNDMWQIRISISKGGIHGLLIDNIFYVVWLDPQHNLYPDENHGGLKKIIPPSTCCKERDKEIDELKAQIKELESYRDILEKNTN